jgi:hypothetical protein
VIRVFGSEVDLERQVDHGVEEGHDRVEGDRSDDAIGEVGTVREVWSTRKEVSEDENAITVNMYGR